MGLLWTKLLFKVLNLNSKMRVKINVGGKVFETTSDTLQPSEYFRNLLERWNDGDEIFIDRDPQIFRSILNWLRGCGDLGEEYLAELEFYGINLDDKPETFNIDQYKGLKDGNATWALATLQDAKTMENININIPPIKEQYIEETVVINTDCIYMFRIPQHQLDMITDMKLLSNINIEANVVLQTNGLPIANWCGLKSVNGECKIPFFENNPLLITFIPYSKCDIIIEYTTPPPSNVVLVLNGCTFEKQNIYTLFQKPINKVSQKPINTLISSRHIISEKGNKWNCNKHWVKICKTGQVDIIARSGDKVVPVDYLKICWKNYYIIIRPEEFKINILTQFDYPIVDIELISRWSIDSFEMSIEQQCFFVLKDGALVSLYA